MEHRLEEMLTETLGKIRKDFEVTNAAEALIRLTIGAIGSDLPSNWPASPRTPSECQELAINRLPYFLGFVASTRKAKKIGIFELLEAAPQLIGMFFVFKYP
jgi:hypothetical protein